VCFSLSNIQMIDSICTDSFEFFSILLVFFIDHPTRRLTSVTQILATHKQLLKCSVGRTLVKLTAQSTLTAASVGLIAYRQQLLPSQIARVSQATDTLRALQTATEPSASLAEICRSKREVTKVLIMAGLPVECRIILSKTLLIEFLQNLFFLRNFLVFFYYCLLSSDISNLLFL
jgi:hypothetical protein